MKAQLHNSSLLILVFSLYFMPYKGFAVVNEASTGMEIMEEVYKRHQQFPHIYEEQYMVLEDKNGDRNTRKARRYSKLEQDGSVHFLLLFDYPEEVKGVALLANRNSDGVTKKYLYLPGFGEQLIESSGAGSDDNFLGTDFSVENLTGEILTDHHYVRLSNENIEDNEHIVLDVYNKQTKETDAFPLRRHYIRQDNLYIVLTHHFDNIGRISRIQSHHDLLSVDTNMWRANMILIEDKKEQHQSLIKISRRIFSHDYVPDEIFTAEWLYQNQPYIEPASEDDETVELVEEAEE